MSSDGFDELVIEVFKRAAMYEYRCICGRLRHKYMQDADRIIEDNDEIIRKEIGITLYKERWDYPITRKEATERRKETLKRIVEAIEGGKNEKV